MEPETGISAVFLGENRVWSPLVRGVCIKIEITRRYNRRGITDAGCQTMHHAAVTPLTAFRAKRCYLPDER